MSQTPSTSANATVPFEGEWRDDAGQTWLARKLIDNKWKKIWQSKHPGQPYPAPEPMYDFQWPALLKLQVEVQDCKAPPILGRIRALRIRTRSDNGGVLRDDSVMVYHLGDLRASPPANKKADAEAADRQQDKSGRWLLSPRATAERLGVDITREHAYRVEGIPWMNWRKPTKVKARRYGTYGPKISYWLESEVDEFIAARDAIGEQPANGLVRVKDVGGIPRWHLNKLAREDGVRREEAKGVGGRRKSTRVANRPSVSVEDVAELRRALAQDQRPADTMTVREIAALFGVTENWILQWFPKSHRRLGTLRIPYRTKDGANRVQIRTGSFFIPIAKVQRKWLDERPGEAWPLTAQAVIAVSAVPLLPRSPEPPVSRPATPATASMPLPRWDSDNRTLYLGDELVKGFGRHPAENQVELLEAFQREGWVSCIASPFHVKGNVAKCDEKLRQTCKDLNKGLSGKLRFFGDGTGDGVRWSLRL